MKGKRHRASINGGYRRATVTIPHDLFRRAQAYVSAKPGLTMSAYVSEVLDQAVRTQPLGS
jgi:hypothetical protein